MGSNNNVGVSPGQNPRVLGDRTASPNQMHNMDNLSNRSISPNDNMNNINAKTGFGRYDHGSPDQRAFNSLTGAQN
jgi:hypothetical protein